MFDLTLTFDNGPEPDVTPGVLDTLERHAVKSTFFVLGKKLADPARRKLAERTSAEGHWIGNHTYTHSIPLGESTDPEVAEAELGRTQNLIGGLAHPDRLFRPFGRGGALGAHLLNRRVVDFLVAGRFSCVLWNAIPRDWEDADGWPARAHASCGEQAWTLMVLHDLPTGAMRHLERFIEDVRAAGGRFRQDFPLECLPLLRGEPQPGLQACVSA
jgi:peptidoglycan/xylan/chitin deacetylase (PgdA/CDA1 family)